MEMRTGPELVRASNEYAKEDRAVTWRLLGVSLAVWAACTGLAIFVPLWPVQLLFSFIAGLTLVRLFIFFHDQQHGAIFVKSPVGEAIMAAVGMYTLNPPSVWKETHDYHHKNNAKMLGGSIGSYPVVSTAMWPAMTPSQRFWYSFARHPLTILTGYVTIFMLGMCLSSFARNPRVHWQGPLAIVLHFGLAGLVGILMGPMAAFAGVILPVMLATLSGGYLFYAQHNFPDIVLRDRKTWEYSYAAIRSSSMMDMSPVMHWFTGNIGYHHVHHLNHRIPFYRLPEAMAAMPELQDPGRTSWAPKDVVAALRLKLWDPKLQKMVGWEGLDGVDASAPAEPISAAN